jgi:ferritin
MLNSAIEQAMNNQIQMELKSAYAYLAMASCFEERNLEGFAKWMRLQANEELEHAMKFFDYIHDRGGRVQLQTIESPGELNPSPLGAFELALHHEQRVSASINKIYELAVAESDFASQSFLNWFVDEQVEEEKNAETAVAKLKMAGDDPAALLMLDHEFGKRE